MVAPSYRVEAEIDGDEEAEAGDAKSHREIIIAERMQSDAKAANDAGSGE